MELSGEGTRDEDEEDNIMEEDNIGALLCLLPG